MYLHASLYWASTWYPDNNSEDMLKKRKEKKGIRLYNCASSVKALSTFSIMKVLYRLDPSIHPLSSANPGSCHRGSSLNRKAQTSLSPAIWNNSFRGVLRCSQRRNTVRLAQPGYQMPEPPQLGYLLDNQASHRISRGESRHPVEETHFGRLYQKNLIFLSSFLICGVHFWL